MVFKRFVDSELKTINNAKIAMFNWTETKGAVLLKSATELKTFTKVNIYFKNSSRLNFHFLFYIT